MNMPTCPYCGHVEKDAWEIDFGGMEGDIVHTCNSCGADYLLQKSVRVSYSALALAIDPEESEVPNGH